MWFDDLGGWWRPWDWGTPAECDELAAKLERLMEPAYFAAHVVRAQPWQ